MLNYFEKCQVYEAMKKCLNTSIFVFLDHSSANGKDTAEAYVAGKSSYSAWYFDRKTMTKSYVFFTFITF